MTKIKNSDETTLLIKLPPELKASFQGLCKFRGVSVSAELRRFMADQVAGTAHGMTTADSHSVNNKPLNTPVSLPTTNKAALHRRSYKDAIQGDLGLSSPLKKATKATKKKKR